MIVLFSTLDPPRIEWLPQWVAHYRAMGVERFVLTLQLDPSLAERARAICRRHFTQTLAQLDIADEQFLDDRYDARIVKAHQDGLQARFVSADDWVVWCDSDEFQIYPHALPDLTAWCAAQQVRVVGGIMIDRVAADGGLPEFRPEVPVWETFPRACMVSLTLARAEVRKIVLARGDVRLSAGNHTLRDAQAIKTLDGSVQIHHFKWHAQTLSALRARVLPAWRATSPWWEESQRMLDYFSAHGMRFDPADLRPVRLDGNALLPLGW